MNRILKNPPPENTGEYSTEKETESAASVFALAKDRQVTPAEIVELARKRTARVQITEDTRTDMLDSCAALEELLERGEAIYGETTGFGPHVRYARGEAASETHGRHLLEHLGAGAGETTPREIVRAAILLRTLTMSRGYSAVRPDILISYARLLELDAYPAVPVLGSVGASGDLVPLAHIARAVTGQGRFCTNESGTELREADDVLAAHELPAIEPRAREALAMTNGVSYSAAWAIFALYDARVLLERAEELAGMIYATLGSPRAALDPVLHFARGHADQADSAERIADFAKRYTRNDTTPADRPGASVGAAASDNPPTAATPRPLQEVYSLRCIPQIIGAARAQLAHSESLLSAEINGVSDNPAIYRDAQGRAQVAHGGNFFGQQIAFAADAINQASTQLGLLIERQIALLCNPAQNGGAPLLLAGTRGLDSGLAGAQLSATAIVAEMRLRCQSASTATIPTNGDNQDIVSMATLAARSAAKQNEYLASLLAILAIAIRQLNYLRASRQAPGDAIQLPGWLQAIAPLPHDRALQDDIAQLAERLRAR